MMSLGVFNVLILPGDSASNRNKDQHYLQGGKVCCCLGLTKLQLPRAYCLEIMVVSGPVQTCAGIALSGL